MAGLTACLFGALFFIARNENADWLAWANAALTVYFSLSAGMLFWAFRRQAKSDPYSYNTIFYSGFSLFVLSLAVTHGYACGLYFANPGVYDDRQMLFTLINSAKNYMFLTTPFLLGFSAALLIANLRLIKIEGRRFVNVLGILLSLLLVLGELGIGILDVWTSLPGGLRVVPVIAVNLLAALYLYFECMMTGTLIANLTVRRIECPTDRDFLIVLGCGIRADGTPTPLLRGRLDLALDFYRRQLSQTGKAPRFIVSGGQGPDEVRSEAAAMRDYLLGQGVAEGEILTEDRSSDTSENMRYSAAIADSLLPEGKTAYFTTNYHVFRAGIKARQAGLRPVGMGAATKWWFWPNAAVREFIGLLTEHRRTQLLIALGMIAAYTALTILAFS